MVNEKMATAVEFRNTVARVRHCRSKHKVKVVQIDGVYTRLREDESVMDADRVAKYGKKVEVA